MKPNRILLPVLAVAPILFAFVLHAANSGLPTNRQAFQLNLGIQPYLLDERIVGFEITLKEGGFAALPAIPIGWSVKIDNSASWQCSASGLVEVGAASMSKQELEDMFLILPAPNTKGPPALEVIIHTTRDFVASTKHTVTTAKLIVVTKAPSATKP